LRSSVDAVRQGAPQAEQGAVRWHLLQNLTGAVQRVVACRYSRLREIVQRNAESVNSEQPEQAKETTLAPPLSCAEQRRRAREEQKQARCVEALRLHTQGMPILVIARQLRMVGVLPWAHDTKPRGPSPPGGCGDRPHTSFEP
jgi:hypothetical protein